MKNKNLDWDLVHMTLSLGPANNILGKALYFPELWCSHFPSINNKPRKDNLTQSFPLPLDV